MMGEPLKADLTDVAVKSYMFGMVGGYHGLIPVAADAAQYRMSPVEASYRGGAKCLLSMLSYHGVRNYLIEKRGVEDAYTTIAAASAGAAAFGLAYKGPPLERMKMMGVCILGGVPANLFFNNWMAS